jgi:hypothetical protein
MDQLITIKEVTKILKNAPSLSPRPDFTKVCALQKHIIKALKQLKCPQSQIHRWSGLVMDLAPAFFPCLVDVDVNRQMGTNSVRERGVPKWEFLSLPTRFHMGITL